MDFSAWIPPWTLHGYFNPGPLRVTVKGGTPRVEDSTFQIYMIANLIGE